MIRFYKKWESQILDKKLKIYREELKNNML